MKGQGCLGLWWSQLAAKEKIRAFLGTFKRIFVKQLMKRRHMQVFVLPLKHDNFQVRKQQQV